MEVKVEVKVEVKMDNTNHSAFSPSKLEGVPRRGGGVCLSALRFPLSALRSPLSVLPRGRMPF